VQYLAPTGVRRYERPRAITLAALGVVVSGSVAMASPASTAPAAQNAYIAAPVRAGQAATTSEIPSLTALIAATRVAGRANRAATPRVTTTTVWSDRNSVGPGKAVHFTGKVTYGTSRLPVPSDLVNLQVRSGSTWKTLESRLASGDGSVVFTVMPTKSSTYRVGGHDDHRNVPAPVDLVVPRDRHRLGRVLGGHVRHRPGCSGGRRRGVPNG
jgi:hypothetical protein